MDTKGLLTIRVDRRAIDALDRIAGAAGDRTDGVMRRFFADVDQSVELLGGSEGIDRGRVRNQLAYVLLRQPPKASPEALRFLASVFARAAELAELYQTS